MKCDCCEMELTDGAWYVFSQIVVDEREMFAMTPFMKHNEAVRFVKGLDTTDKWLLSQDKWDKIKAKERNLTCKDFGKRWDK